MQPSEVAELCYPTPYPVHVSVIHNNIPSIQVSRFLRFSHDCPSVHEFAPQSLNSPSDKAEEHQLMSIVDERKQRRMISNRESARRSRMRKQKHLDELWSQVLRLQTENRQLIDKLNHVSDTHDRVVKENSCLREEASELRRMLNEVQQLNNHPYNALRDLEVPCNTAHLRAESSNQSITSSMDLLH